MLHEWDNSDYRSGCSDFDVFVSRNYAVIECLNSKILVYPRFKGKNDGDALPRPVVIEDYKNEKIEVTTDDKLYIATNSKSFVTIQLQ